jgi:serine/threonine-protein kinase
VTSEETAATKTSLPTGTAGRATDAATSPVPGPMLSSDSFDDGRFLPGTVLAERYRVIGVVGRGGMGEVYRADDLKLGQTVALKFLPEGLEQDSSRLARFFNEVRTARQVTHPNVCRVYDTGEVGPSTGSGQGHHFISMEFVDGEDLGSLLRRIGRLPREKAVQIGRQLCAGLAAAHEQGILHRDLKPANVMVDGRGRVRITDFGLAGLATAFEGAEIRAGTPSYMAPEQLAGKQVSVRSDIYALGLVLYELFTGKQAYEARTPAELQQMQESTPTSPSSLVDGLDPSVERAILRCLEKDPRQRPATALAVAAALPGGDPLAEALAAGETPSPEMVADAGGEGGVKPSIAVICFVAIVLGMFGDIALRASQSLYNKIAMDRPPEALAVQARELIVEAGHDLPRVDSAYGFGVDTSYFDYVEEQDTSRDHWAGLADAQPSPLWFWYRQSPRYMAPENLFDGGLRVRRGDPANDVSGMARVDLDSDGRLLGLVIVPPQRDDSVGPWPEPNWTPLLEQARLDLATLEPVPPEWNPPFDCDARAAWQARYPDQPDVPIRVEAGAYRGKPVFFRTVTPWARPTRMEADATSVGENVANAILVTILFALLIGGTLLARRNVRLGRGDRRGAFRIATFMFVVGMLEWAIAGAHVPRFAEVGLLINQIAWGLFFAGAVWVCYVALEPHVRRIWPDLIISWTRLLSGRYRDPLVGRAILAGGLCFVVSNAWVNFGERAMVWMGVTTGRPSIAGYRALEGVRQAVGAFLGQLVGSIWIPIGFLFLILLLRVLLRRQWAAVLAFIVILTASTSLGNPSEGLLTAAILSLGLWSLVIIAMIRFGLLAVVMWLVFLTITSVPATTDLSAWYAGRTLFNLLVLTALACYGFWISLAGRPLFASDPLADSTG